MEKTYQGTVKRRSHDTFLFVLFVILWLLILNILIFNTLAERRASSPLTTSLPPGITGRVGTPLGVPLPQETFIPIIFFNAAIAFSFTLNYFALAKKKRSARKGQSAFEFLSSYGWALAAGVLTLGALGYFGVLNLGIFVPESCILIPGLSCDSTVVYDEATGHYAVSVLIRNGFGEDLVDVSVASLIDGMTCSAVGISGEETTTIPSGQTASFSLDCVVSGEGAPLGGGAVVDLGGMAVEKVNRLKAQLQITYKLRSKQLSHTVLGTLISKPAAVATGGGGGGSQGDGNATNMTHLECVNQMCAVVNGTGIDQCTSNANCQNQTVNQTNITETNLTAGNAQAYVIRLDYGPTKYSITLKDPDGIGQFSVRTITGSSLWSGSPPCSYTSLTSGTATIEDSWFPLSWYNVDCTGKRQEGSIPLPPAGVSCTDSDGGKNYYSKGTTWDSYSGIDKIDYCSDSKSLVEYYCLDGSRKLTLVSCLDKCIDGACIKTYCAGPGLSAQVYGGGKCCEGLILQGGICNVPPG
ncbi:hypothetical protein HYS50_00655 [Candidatus Woesearchaeota archaeon]|nr:hypothetical protein [Candidatus Woesearchaeota archaeon]